jgi:hypothetical protein
MRTLLWLAVVEVAVAVPLWVVLRACRGQGRPLWRFVTRREL